MKLWQLTIDTGQIEKAEQMLAGQPDKVEKALKSAMSEARKKLTGSAVREIRKEYDIERKDIREEEEIRHKILYHPGVGVEAAIVFRGANIPLIRFASAMPQMRVEADKRNWVRAGGEWFRPQQSVASAGNPKKGDELTIFNYAFTTTFKSGHTGIFERYPRGNVEKTEYWRDPKAWTSGKKWKLVELMGPAVPKMVSNKDVQEAMLQGASEKFHERLDHNVEAILKGYWKEGAQKKT